MSAVGAPRDFTPSVASRGFANLLQRARDQRENLANGYCQDTIQPSKYRKRPGQIRSSQFLWESPMLLNSASIFQVQRFSVTCTDQRKR